MYNMDRHKIHIEEKIKNGLEAQRIQLLRNDKKKIIRRLSIRTMIDQFSLIQRIFLKYTDGLYCRTMSLIFSRSC